jgi:hypothetical protein
MLRAFGRAVAHHNLTFGSSTTRLLPLAVIAPSNGTSLPSTTISPSPSTCTTVPYHQQQQQQCNRSLSTKPRRDGLIAPRPKRRLNHNLNKLAPTLILPEFVTVKDLAVLCGATQMEIAFVGQRLFDWWPAHTKRQLRSTGFAVLKPVVLNYIEAKQIALAYHRQYVLGFDDHSIAVEGTEEERRIAFLRSSSGIKLSTKGQSLSDALDQRDRDTGLDYTQRLLVKPKQWSETDLKQGRKPKLADKVPVITIMGHVDHGKTTLLDVLRGSNLADREDARITQEVYSFQVAIDGKDEVTDMPTVKDVTFLDTPVCTSFLSCLIRVHTNYLII